MIRQWSGRWESNCIPKLQVLCFDGVAAHIENQLELNGARRWEVKDRNKVKVSTLENSQGMRHPNSS
jgi:hypothetical protein